MCNQSHLPAPATNLGAPSALLTWRELEVLAWMATANMYRRIASQLNVSEEIIRSHAKSILEKNEPTQPRADRAGRAENGLDKTLNHPTQY